MMRDDPVAEAIDALLTDEVEARVMEALAAGVPGVREPFVREALTGLHSTLRLYGSTAGPFGGIGGAAMTTFRMTVVYSPDLAILFAGGRLYGIASPAGVDLGLLNPDEFTRVLPPRRAPRA